MRQAARSRGASRPAVLAVVQRQFADFLRYRGSDPAAEFLLSEAVGAQVATGEARVRVLRAEPGATGAHWFGMTFSTDADGVRDAVGRLVDAGVYPANLKTGFERLACD
jgi:hypothetical protein